jgi:muconolactone D-isomerase
VLFLIDMDVKIPHGLDPVHVEGLKAAEKTRAQALQRSGKWRHLWRVAGKYRNISIFDVDSNAELHDILMSLPLFPFMVVRVTALCLHPSSVHDDDR